MAGHTAATRYLRVDEHVLIAQTFFDGVEQLPNRRQCTLEIRAAGFGH
jgi:hypothetical protein